MSLRNGLITTKRRETGGARAADRLDFQTCWGMCHLLDLHERRTEYAIAFEFHDDIVVIDSVTNPGRIRFYQIKTDARHNWTPRRLTNREETNDGNLKPSFAGRMYDNKLRFPDNTELLGFVSNKPASFISEEKYPAFFYDGDAKQFKEFIDEMKLEHPSFTEADANLFLFDQTPANLQNYETHLRGRLHEFIEDYCNLEDCGIGALYRWMVEKCRKKAKFLKDVQTFEELVHSKFLSRDEVEKWLCTFRAKVQNQPNWDLMAPRLGLSPRDEKELCRAWHDYTVSRWSQNDAEISIREFIIQEINHYSHGRTIMEMVEGVLGIVRARAAAAMGSADDNYLRAMILYEWRAAQ